MSLIAATAAAAVLTPVGCFGSATSTDASTPVSPVSEVYSIGIIQITTHTALDSAREGFKKAFEDAGIQVEHNEQNVQSDQATAISTVSGSASSDLDLVLAVATPSVQAVTQLITKIPVLFTAATDLVSARPVSSLEAPGSNITDTTDVNPVADQIPLIRESTSKAKTLGIIYSSDEVNSEVQVEFTKEAAAKDGLQAVESAVTSSVEVQQAVRDLASKVDTIYVPTNNTVVSALASIVQAVEDAKIPLVAGEANPVVQGAPATYGIDYSKFGYQTGEVAIRIPKEGTEPASLPVEVQKDYELTVNTTILRALGPELPASLKDRVVTIEWLESLLSSSSRARDGCDSSLR